MGSGIFFPSISLFYSILLIIYCFKNKRVENKTLKLLVIVNFIGLITELLCTFAAFNIKRLPIISNFILKFYLVYLITWIMLFTRYISELSKTKINRIKVENIIFKVIYIISCVLVLTLPIKLFNQGEVRYTYGLGVSLVYGLSFAFIIYCLFLMFFNINKKVASKYSSLFILTSLGAMAMIIQSTYPGLLLITSVATFVTFIMYFTTLENEVILKLEEKLDKDITSNKENR